MINIIRGEEGPSRPLPYRRPEKVMLSLESSISGNDNGFGSLVALAPNQHHQEAYDGPANMGKMGDATSK